MQNAAFCSAKKQPFPKRTAARSGRNCSRRARWKTIITTSIRTAYSSFSPNCLLPMPTSAGKRMRKWARRRTIKMRWKKPITPIGRTRCCCTQTWSAPNVSWRRASFRITRIFAARFYWSNTRRKSRMKPPRISMNCRGNVFWMMCLQTTRKKGWRCGGGFWTSQNRL